MISIRTMDKFKSAVGNGFAIISAVKKGQRKDLSSWRRILKTMVSLVQIFLRGFRSFSRRTRDMPRN